MYHGSGTSRSVQRLRDEAPAGPDPATLCRQALTRVRKCLTAWLVGTSPDPARLLTALAVALPQPALDAERFLALGWVSWLQDQLPRAERFLTEAVERSRSLPAPVADAPGSPEEPPPLPGPVLLGLAGYWLARVRLGCHRAEALAGYEALLRSLAGSPQATVWFVDLLWRTGAVGRAEQVWKSIQGNRKVLACEEATLLEARGLFRRGEWQPAERILQEARFSSGVNWSERYLLLAWAQASLRQFERARESLVLAGSGLLPASVLRFWHDCLEARAAGHSLDVAPERLPPGWSDFVRGQQARERGDRATAEPAYRAALSCAAVASFVRYGLVDLGLEDAADLLASQPGSFLAGLCQFRITRARFLARVLGPAEMSTTLDRVARAGYRDDSVAELQTLLGVLQARALDAEQLDRLTRNAPDAAAERNRLRAALEAAGRILAPAQVVKLLVTWLDEGRLHDTGELAEAVGRQLLRLALRDRSHAADTIPRVRALLPEEPLVDLAASLAGGPEVAWSEPTEPAQRLWDLARQLDGGAVAENWQAEVKALRQDARLGRLAQGLLVQEAARRGDTTTVPGLLQEEVDLAGSWPGEPPGFALRALEALALAQPTLPGWRTVLPRWLQSWAGRGGGVGSSILAGLAGLAPALEAPPGFEPVPWLLHQGARTLGRNDARAALVCLERALLLAPDLPGIPGRDAALAALPWMQRRAHAQALAEALGLGSGMGLPPNPSRPHPLGFRARPHDHSQHPPSPELLDDLVGILVEFPRGRALLAHADRSDQVAVQSALADLMEDHPSEIEHPDRLAHHLALLALRLAQHHEEQEDDQAFAWWQRAWGCWLRFLLTSAVPGSSRGLLLDHLLGLHRRRINALLSGSDQDEAVERARRHYLLVGELPVLAARLPGPLAQEMSDDLTSRVERFRDELATEYLLITREAMRYGEIPEGWRADYERGLAFLERSLSLDADNVRLLTTLLEVCADWFVDLYNANDGGRLFQELSRSTPHALRLARLVSDRPSELAARAILSQFCKFRGFLARDRAQKIAFYQQALEFNPGNSNARELLAELNAGECDS
jgi:hypothetical protein